MHRNAEIWEKRYDALQAMRTAHHHHINMAYAGAASDDERARIAYTQRWWMNRWDNLIYRMWNALCVAKGWRKA